MSAPEGTEADDRSMRERMLAGDLPADVVAVGHPARVVRTDVDA